MSSARRRESSADDGHSVMVASRSVEMSGYDTYDESEEFSPSQYLKYRLENSCDAKQSDRQSDAGQDWVGYSDTPSSLTSSSSGDYEKIDYKPKFTAAEAKLMRSAIKASLAADTCSPYSKQVRLCRCALARLLSVRSIPYLDRKLLVTTKATRPFSLLSPHARTRLNTHPGQETTCPPTPPCLQRQACQGLLLHRPLMRVFHGLSLCAAVCLHDCKGSWWQGINPAVTSMT